MVFLSKQGAGKPESQSPFSHFVPGFPKVKTEGFNLLKQFQSNCSRLPESACFILAKLGGKSYTRNNLSSSCSRLPELFWSYTSKARW
jgi:hypothetical protein